MGNYVIDTEHRVTPLELFFDLVFVFGFTQVTILMTDDASWRGLGRGLLVLAVIWWAWSSYAWLTNAVDADAGKVVAVVMVAITAMFVAALAVPEAFGRHRLVFGTAFLIVIVTFVGLFTLAGRNEPDLSAAVLRLVWTTVPGAALILAAAFVPYAVRPVLWLGALAYGFIGPGLGSLSGWRVQPAHFTERHGPQRIALARDLYTYLHLPMVAGIVLFAYGTKVTVAHVHAELHSSAAFALCGGSAIYLLAYVALRWRVSRRLRSGRLIAAAGFASLVPVAVFVPALVTLALVTAVWFGLHAYELIWWREERARRRAGAPQAV